MKKLSIVVAGMVGIFSMSGALAAYPDLEGGPNPVTMVDCPLLANDISLVLSNNVVGGVECNVNTGVVALSLCHVNGQKASRSAVVTTNEDGTVKCAITATEKCVETVTGAMYPSANTTQGTVASQFPGGDECSASIAGATAKTLAPAPATP